MEISLLKVLLNIEGDDSQDELLTALLTRSQHRINGYTGDTTFPEELNWVAEELTIKRYNKLSAEGLESEGISGIVHKFETDMLGEFTETLDRYIQVRDGRSGGKRLVML